jgi:hypothetical protein
MEICPNAQCSPAIFIASIRKKLPVVNWFTFGGIDGCYPAAACPELLEPHGADGVCLRRSVALNDLSSNYACKLDGQQRDGIAAAFCFRVFDRGGGCDDRLVVSLRLDHRPISKVATGLSQILG